MTENMTGKKNQKQHDYNNWKMQMSGQKFIQGILKRHAFDWINSGLPQKKYNKNSCFSSLKSLNSCPNSSIKVKNN